MKTFFVILILLLLTACRTQYELTIERDGLTIKGKSSSYREYALFSMEYNPATHDISLIAVGVTDDTAEVVRDVVTVGGDVARDVVNPVHGAPVTDTAEAEKAWQRYLETINNDSN